MSSLYATVLDWHVTQVHFATGQSVSARTVCIKKPIGSYLQTIISCRSVLSCIKYQAVCPPLVSSLMSLSTQSFQGLYLEEAVWRNVGKWKHSSFSSSDSIYLVILIFRTWVIWGKNRRVAIVLPILLVIGLIPLVYLTRIGLTSITCLFSHSSWPPRSHGLIVADVAELPIPRLQSCFVIKLHNVTILWDYVLMLGFETGEQ